MKTATRMATIFTDDNAMVMLTGVYFIDFRKNTKPKAHTRHRTMVSEKSCSVEEALVINDTSVLEKTNVSQSKPKKKDAIIPLNNTR